MQAQVGDRIIVRTHRLGVAERNGEIVEVHGEGGAPPYVVRWSESGHEGLFFPGPDVLVARTERPGRGRRGRG